MLRNKLKRYIGHLIIGVICASAWAGLQYIYFSSMPSSRYFEYHDVSPTKNFFEVGEDLTFYSDREIKKGGDYEYRDILRCWQDVNVVRFSESITGGVATKKLRHTTGVWNYGGATPSKPSECYLESQVSIYLPFSIKKTQSHIGGPFFIQ